MSHNFFFLFRFSFLFFWFSSIDLIKLKLIENEFQKRGEGEGGRDRMFQLDDRTLYEVLDERVSMNQMLEMVAGRLFRRGLQRRRRRHGCCCRCRRCRRHFDFVGEEATKLLFGVGCHQHFRWYQSTMI